MTFWCRKSFRYQVSQNSVKEMHCEHKKGFKRVSLRLLFRNVYPSCWRPYLPPWPYIYYKERWLLQLCIPSWTNKSCHEFLLQIIVSHSQILKSSTEQVLQRPLRNLPYWEPCQSGHHSVASTIGDYRITTEPKSIISGYCVTKAPMPISGKYWGITVPLSIYRG